MYRFWFRLPTFAFVVVFHCCCCLIDVVLLLLLFFNKCCFLFVQMLVSITYICICGCFPLLLLFNWCYCLNVPTFFRPAHVSKAMKIVRNKWKSKYEKTIVGNNQKDKNYKKEIKNVCKFDRHFICTGFGFDYQHLHLLLFSIVAVV